MTASEDPPSRNNLAKRFGGPDALGRGYPGW